MSYGHIAADSVRKPWAILPERLRTIAELIALHSAGKEVAARRLGASLAAARAPQRDYGAVAVIALRGIISYRPDVFTRLFGGTSMQALTASFRQAIADPGVKTIVFDVDSPGGCVEGARELAGEIFQARPRKRSVAVANSTAAASAYWIASACSEMVVTQSGSVGSIGVFSVHEDLSKAMEAEGVKISLISAGRYKTDGNCFERLSSSARSDMQSKVDGFYGMFVQDVARGRGASPAKVRGGMGEGRLVLAADALREGMVDRIASLDQTLAREDSLPGGFSTRASSSLLNARLRPIGLLRRELELLCR